MGREKNRIRGLLGFLGNPDQKELLEGTINKKRGRADKQSPGEAKIVNIAALPLLQ